MSLKMVLNNPVYLVHSDYELLVQYDTSASAVLSLKLSRGTACPTRLHVRPAKTQISLYIRAVRSESSQSTQWIAKNAKRLHADSEDSDQPAQI